MIESNSIQKFLKSLAKFGLTSLLATAVDFLSFMFLFSTFLPIFWAEVCAAICGMIVNFFMQKRFVFILQRKASSAFTLSLLISFILMFAGASAMSGLTQIAVFAKYLFLAKLLVMGSKFLINYFTKKWIFEKSIRH